MTLEVINEFQKANLPVSEWDLQGLNESILRHFNFLMDSSTLSDEELTPETLKQLVVKTVQARYQEKESLIGTMDMRQLERFVMLQTVDNLWKDHLLNMDHLKEGIGLRGYAQQNPLIVYKKEGFEMFQALIHRIKEETLAILFRIQIAGAGDVQERQRNEKQNLTFSHSDASLAKKPIKRAQAKVGRNDPCPCGSGKKYKKCCGAS